MADEDEVREILQDIDALSTGARRLSIGSASASSLAWTLPTESELTRLEYENSFLQSAETLLESKCAALDSRLEETESLLRVRDKLVQKQRQELAAKDAELRQACNRVSSLEDAARTHNNQLAELRAAAHNTARDEDAALEMQIRATTQACEENQVLCAEVDRLRGELRQAHADAERVNASNLAQGELQIALERAQARVSALESQLEAEKTTNAHSMQKIDQENEKHKIECSLLREQLSAVSTREGDLGARLHEQLEKSVENASHALRRADRADAQGRQLERERDAAQSELEAERGRRQRADTEATMAVQECARLQSSLRLEKEERARDAAQAKHDAEDTRRRLCEVEADLEAERESNRALRQKLAEVSRKFEAALTQTRKTAGAATQESRALREMLRECESLLLERASRPRATRSSPHTPSRNRLSQRDSEASRLIAQSAESLRMRKLRMGTAQSPRSMASPSSRAARTSLRHNTFHELHPLRRSALSGHGQDLSEMFASLAT
ncbi:Laminin subunit alpha-5 [Hondaea fermentalgiana]|uniref:Laminin subunit alpha-5 n=1 Tax=Hondaea fermentalgiana TaxID=2315210 RepID=A0A2R5GB52_9STRA|nr:Laminin subunit alpha-5 [Hondaea fermentalgiana]|eukprot:GBG25351.1 Laminin subunit alpha-5 [Hondaea fermentalgiana]